MDKISIAPNLLFNLGFSLILLKLGILLGYHCCGRQPNLLSLIIIIFKGTRFHKIISLLTWRIILKGVN
jgi:hypothetical protein